MSPAGSQGILSDILPLGGFYKPEIENRYMSDEMKMVTLKPEKSLLALSRTKS